MAIRVHQPEHLPWRRIGDIPMGGMLAHIDPSEQDCHLAFHEAGDATTLQLMEMRLKPHALVAPHSHDDDEIFFVAQGSLEWGDRALGQGGSMYIPARTAYSFRAGGDGAVLLNFRGRADHSFRPVADA